MRLFTLSTFLFLAIHAFGQSNLVVSKSFDTLECKSIEVELYEEDENDYLILEKLDGSTSRIPMNMVFNYSINGKWKLFNQAPLPVDEATGKITYEKIQTVDGVSAGDLYARAKYWVANNYVSANDVIQLDDPANQILVVKGNIPTDEFNGIIQHTLEIACKNGKYKVQYKNLRFEWWHEGLKREYALHECYPAKEKLKGNNLHWKFVVRATNKMNQSILASLNSLDNSMRKPVQSDW